MGFPAAFGMIEPSGGGGGPVEPPASGENYELQVDDSTPNSLTVAFNPYETTNKNAADSVKVFVDTGGGFVQDGTAAGDLDNYTITGLASGQTISVKIQPVVGGIDQAESNTILGTTERTLGNQWIQHVGVSAASPITLAGEQKFFRWGIVDKGNLTTYQNTRVMIRRYDNEFITGVNAEWKASWDIEGRRGYEVLPPTNTGQNTAGLFVWGWTVPVELGAVYRLFVAGENSAGLASDWMPGPVFTEGQSWKPGANIRPKWTTADTGTGSITLVSGGTDQQTFNDWNTAINTIQFSDIQQKGDGLRIDGTVRITSPTQDNYLKISGDRWRRPRIFGGTGPETDSLRGSFVAQGPYTLERAGVYSMSILGTPLDNGSFPDLKTNDVWVEDYKLKQAGEPSSRADLNTEWIGYAHWGNVESYQDSSNMSEGTYYNDTANNKIWFRLPGGANPANYTIEIGIAANILSGVDANAGDAMRNYWELENLTFAHSNGSGLNGSVKSTVSTGREGWVIKNVAILGGCTQSLNHLSIKGLVDNVLVDGGSRMAILSRNTGPTLDWYGDPAAPKMRTLMQNVSVTAANRGEYFCTNHIGNKRIPAHRYYHERRCFIGARTTNTFSEKLYSMCMGTWFDVGFEANIVEENYYENIPFSWYVEITPEDIMGRTCDWSSACRNNVQTGLNQTYRIFIDANGGATPGKTQAAYGSSSYRVLAGFNTMYKGTTGIFFGGLERTINELNYTSTAKTKDCAMMGNFLSVLGGEWANFHMQGTANTEPNVANWNCHDEEFSFSNGFGKTTDRTVSDGYGFALDDVVATGVTFQDLAGGALRITGGTNSAANYGAQIPTPELIQY